MIEAAGAVVLAAAAGGCGGAALATDRCPLSAAQASAAVGVAMTPDGPTSPMNPTGDCAFTAAGQRARVEIGWSQDTGSAQAATNQTVSASGQADYAFSQAQVLWRVEVIAQHDPARARSALETIKSDLGV